MVFGAEKPQQILATGWQSEKGKYFQVDCGIGI
jgi:hypothetical protein